MKIIVQKFGGSSVADLDKIKKIAEKIASVKREGYDVVAVVSAMGKTTNQLIEQAKSLSSDPPRREMDMLLSTGERITMSLLCMALNENSVKAISLTGSQSGIITNDRHNDARVIEVRPFRVQDELAKGQVVVIGGFQGVSYKRDITTLGRGGSDTSAIALAAALNAERCDIYSDVPGVFSADPVIVKDAKHLEEISYQQMQEMSKAGARVLNAQAVEFAKEKQIAIYARSTFESGKETIIRSFPPGAETGIKSVVYEKEVVRVILKSENISYDFEWLINFLEDKQVQLKELNFVDDEKNKLNSRTSFIISHTNVYGWEKVKAELQNHFKDKIEFENDLGAVSLIGEGLNRDNLILKETLLLMKQNNIKVYGIATTSFRISLLISKNEIEKAVTINHQKWIGDG